MMMSMSNDMICNACIKTLHESLLMFSLHQHIFKPNKAKDNKVTLGVYCSWLIVHVLCSCVYSLCNKMFFLWVRSYMHV